MFIHSVDSFSGKPVFPVPEGKTRRIATDICDGQFSAYLFASYTPPDGKTDVISLNNLIDRCLGRADDEAVYTAFLDENDPAEQIFRPVLQPVPGYSNVIRGLSLAFMIIDNYSYAARFAFYGDVYADVFDKTAAKLELLWPLYDMYYSCSGFVQLNDNCGVSVSNWPVFCSPAVRDSAFYYAVLKDPMAEHSLINVAPPPPHKFMYMTINTSEDEW